jgi:hypothetical protein
MAVVLSGTAMSRQTSLASRLSIGKVIQHFTRSISMLAPIRSISSLLMLILVMHWDRHASLNVPRYDHRIYFRKDMQGSYICGYRQGIALLDEKTGEVSVLKELISKEDREGMTMNGGAVNPQGSILDWRG